MPLSFNGPGKIFTAGGSRHTWAFVACCQRFPSVPLNSAGPCRLTNSPRFELHALMLLNAADDLEQVACVGIAGRSEHAHQALGRPVREGAQFLESDGGVGRGAARSL